METFLYSMALTACFSVPVLVAVYWHAVHRVDIVTLKKRLDAVDKYKAALDERHERMVEQQDRLNKWHEALVARADTLDKRTQKLVDLTRKLRADA